MQTVLHLSNRFASILSTLPDPPCVLAPFSLSTLDLPQPHNEEVQQCLSLVPASFVAVEEDMVTRLFNSRGLKVQTKTESYN